MEEEQLSISLEARSLIEDFELAAGQLYWDQDQGSQSSIQASQKHRDETYKALFNFIAKLEMK